MSQNAPNFNLEELYKISREMYEKVPYVQKKRKRRAFFYLIKYFSIIALVLILVLAGFTVYVGFKMNVVYVETMEGKAKLENALYSMEDKNFAYSKNEAMGAYKNFEYAHSLTINFSDNPIISHIKILRVTFNNLESLLVSGQVLSRAVLSVANLGDNLNSILPGAITFDNLSLEDKREFLKLVFESTPEINGLKADMELAQLNLNSINDYGLLFPAKDKIIDLKYKVAEAHEILQETMPLLEILPKLAGYPSQSNFLIMLQNTDELRPTGGFLGTYGIAQIDSGDVKRLDTHDIYHLDMPVKDVVTVMPPAPLKEYLGVNKWYLRDANWSPDWMISADKINWFYSEENKRLPSPDPVKDFEAVIAVTPKFITDLLEITGPIEIEGEEYRPDNFTRLLEYRVEMGYEQLGISSWHRKEVIGDIMKEMKIRLLGEKSRDWQKIVDVVYNALVKKDIQIAFTDKNMQKIAKENNFDGSLASNLGDYLLVVDANMAALKTDVVMGRSIEYDVSQSVNGMFSKLQLNYVHRGGGFDWRTTRYRTYTRVYVPFGSEFIDSTGFEENSVTTYTDLGKTVIAGFISIEPGKIKNIIINYKLPDNLDKEITDKKVYSLYLQKQAGKAYENVKVNLNFNQNIANFTPQSLFTNLVNDVNLVWEGDLGTDQVIEVNF